VLFFIAKEVGGAKKGEREEIILLQFFIGGKTKKGIPFLYKDHRRGKKGKQRKRMNTISFPNF